MSVSTLIRPTATGSAAGTSFAAFSASVYDVTVAAAAGDVVEVGIATRWSFGSVYSMLDFATIVGGSPVNYVSSGTGTPNTNGVFSCYTTNINDVVAAGGSEFYTVQAGDISGGNVTFRLYGKVASSTRSLSATGAAPAMMWASVCDTDPVTATISGSATTSWGAFSGTATIPAAAGDVLAVVPNIIHNNDAGVMSMDVATILSGSPNRWISSGGTTHSSRISGWRADRGGVFESAGPSALYTVNADDVVSGQVTFQMFGIMSGGTRSLVSGSHFSVRKIA